MPFEIQADDGTWFVDDAHQFTLSVLVTAREEQNGLRSAKQNAMCDRYAAGLEGLVHVCDRQLLHDRGNIEWRMYFARPGTFYFVPRARAERIRNYVLVKLRRLWEKPGYLQNGLWRQHAPRYFSARVRYQAGRNFLRLYLGPLVADLNLRKRISGD